MQRAFPLCCHNAFPQHTLEYYRVFFTEGFTGNKSALTLKELLKELMLWSLALYICPTKGEHRHVCRVLGAFLGEAGTKEGVGWKEGV